MRAVNLLPRDAAQAKSIRNEEPAVVVGSVLGLVVVIALSAGFLISYSIVSRSNRPMRSLRASVNAPFS